MRHAATWNEPFLPWVESENDRRFKRILLITVSIFMVFGLIMPFLPVPEPERKDLQEVSPRLAKLILEKKKQPPPPPPKPKEEKKKETPKKEEKKAEKKEKPKPKPKESTRKKAEAAGLVALSDDLADLRESFDMSALDTTPQNNSAEAAAATIGTSAVLTAKAKAGSGGINTGSLSKSTGGSELATRSTSTVTSKIGSTQASAKKSSTSKGSARSESEIERVFQKNKAAIYSLYNRALRKDPTLQGKVVLELTISPSGKVTNCRVVSSELNDPALERKLVSRVKLFKFKSGNMSQVTITYPIDFLPS
jgi:TonB family protein